MDQSELLAKKKEVLDEARAIHARVQNEQNGEWRGDEEAKWDGLMKQSDKYQAEVERMARMDSAEKLLAGADTSTGRRSEAPAPQTRQAQSFGKATAQDADLALRGWLLGNGENGARDEHRAAAQKMGITIGSGAVNLKMPPPLRSLSNHDIEAWEKRAAMGVGSGSIGLYSSPDSPMGALERALLAFGGMRQVARVFRTASGTDMPFPTTNDTGNAGALLAENTQVSEVDPTFGQLVLNSFKYSSKLVLVARELLNDSAVNVPEMLGSMLGERIGRIQNTHFTTGDASSKPNGIVTAATSASITTAAAATVTYDNLVDLVHKVDPSYRPGSKFMFHDGALKIVRKLKIMNYSGDVNGQPLWQPALSAGVSDTILGYEYVINQDVTTPGAAAKSFLFGLLSKYLIRDVEDIRLVRMDERYADYDQVGFTAFMRSDGDLLDAGTRPVYYMTQGS
jgi:HK97 family phage major capsid protein